MDIPFTLLIMLLCLLAEGFFSGSEIGVVSSDRLKLREDAAKGSKGARLALEMLEKPEWLLSTTLVGTNIAVVTNTTLATALIMSLLGPQYSWLAAVLLAPLIWVFGEIVPKSVFQQRANELTPRAIFVLRFFSYVFWPILVVFSFLTRLLTRLVGGDKKSTIFTLREQLISMLHMSQPGDPISPNQGKMIQRMFRFSETTAIQVMVPLTDISAVSRRVNCGEALRVAAAKAHAQLAVYEERFDRIVGVVHSLELLGKHPGEPIEPFLRPVRYVGGTKNVQTLMQELRQSDESFAVVVDEYGAIRGMVTAEDIMEEIVLDIRDEFDTKQESTQWLRKIEEGVYLVSGRIERERLREMLGITLSKGDYATLAGYLLEKAHEVPAEGMVIDSHGISYTIMKRTESVIEEVEIHF